MPHILVIEDSYLFGQFVSDAAILAGAGSVEIAFGQSAAEAAATKKAPALIVADVNLDDGSGPDAVHHIASSHGAVPVIYVTGYPERLSGCPDGSVIVQKPVTHDALRNLIGSLVDRFKRRSLAY
jgi:DNA-binding response OmpR family regulator